MLGDQPQSLQSSLHPAKSQARGFNSLRLKRHALFSEDLILMCLISAGEALVGPKTTFFMDEISTGDPPWHANDPQAQALTRH